MKQNTLSALLVATLCLSVLLCGCIDNADKENEVTSSTTQEVYDSLPDKSIYNEDGALIATGKDLIPIESVVKGNS